jgi:hypothetical protein
VTDRAALTCEELGKAYLECQRLLVEARQEVGDLKSYLLPLTADLRRKDHALVLNHH